MAQSFGEYFDKDQMHHAYLVEGERSEIEKGILEFLKDLGVSSDSQDLVVISIDNFKIDEALALRGMERERAIGNKRYFIISANHFSIDAQNTMLKIFEDPSTETQFFLVTPDSNALLPTLLSRVFPVYLNKENKNLKDAENFISSSIKARLDFLKEFLVAPDDEIMEDSIRTKALQFLNSLESIIVKKEKRDQRLIAQIFKVREFLRQPGSSPKMLLESIALLL